MKQILKSFLTVIAVAGVVGTATYAQFSDTETSYANTFSTGTLDLKVDGNDDPNIVHVTLNNMKPGQTASYNWVLSNTGSLAGKPWIEIKNVVNDDNNCNEPEDADDDSCGATGGGELGDYLMMQLNAPGDVGYVYPHGPCVNSGRQCTLNYWASLGNLSTIDGQTWNNINPSSSLAPMVLEFEIPSTVGNIIQSDSVKFDIVFHLDEV